jgi:hypothetical protein
MTHVEPTHLGPEGKGGLWPPKRTAAHQLDIAIAARTSLGVLISAPSKLAERTAMQIVEASGVPAGDVVLVDGGDLKRVLARPRGTAANRPRIVVLRDVHRFDAAQQAGIFKLLAGPHRRVIATTRVSLFDRVLEGSFDEKLFYRLNTIHIDCLSD